MRLRSHSCMLKLRSWTKRGFGNKRKIGFQNQGGSKGLENESVSSGDLK